MGLFRLVVLAVLAGACSAASAADCRAAADDACFRAFEPDGKGTVHYYASLAPGEGRPSTALLAMHGHSRDANKTFEASLLAATRAGALDRTLVVAPLFQVDSAKDGKCHTAGVPPAQPGDLLWTCGNWMEGAPADAGAGPGSFAVLDALVGEIHRQWPSIRSITVAGFSAGGQVVQHYIAFARPAPSGVALRYVVADPGTWLYFDPVRPEPTAEDACPRVNRWKYGTEALPAWLGRDAAAARAAYAAAEVHYLEGALDDSDARGTAARVLDRSCAADAQGPYRLQRGLAYSAYDRAHLAPSAHREVTVVPGCAHDVACVFPSEAARPILFGAP